MRRSRRRSERRRRPPCSPRSATADHGLTLTTPAPSTPAGRPTTLRVLVAEAIAPEGIEALRARHEVDVRIGLSDEELRTAVGDYDALIVRSQVAVDAALIAAGLRL